MDPRNTTDRTEGHSTDETTVTDRRPLQRMLLFGALICFALPFLTVTCYGGETTVSGIEAATSIDLHPDDSYEETQLEREESTNVFAFLALVATATAIVFAYRLRDPRGAVVAAVVGVFALEALSLYALTRAVGEAYPRIGFVGALFLLLGSAWMTVERIPRWIPVAIGALAVSMLPGAILGPSAVAESPVLYLPLVFGGLVAVAIAVGALHGRTQRRTTDVTPSTVRLVAAGMIAIVVLALGIVAGFVVATIVSSDFDENSYLFALVTIAVTAAASSGAWATGRAIARSRPRERVVAVAYPTP